MLKKRRKLKSAITLATSALANAVHDRRAANLPFNHKIAVVTVDDPYGLREFASDAPAERTSGLRTANAGATELRSSGRPQVEVVASLRGDPLLMLFLHKGISKLHLDAGRAYQNDIDRAVIGGARAIDYSRAKVDGGSLGNPLGTSVLIAQDRLAVADASLNRASDAAIKRHGVALCRAVIERGITVADYSRSAGVRSKHGFAKMTELFRSCLDILAEVYGLATRRAA